MHGLIMRIIEDTVKQCLEDNQSAVLLGARQTGMSA